MAREAHAWLRRHGGLEPRKSYNQAMTAARRAHRDLAQAEDACLAAGEDGDTLTGIFREEVSKVEARR